MGEGWVQFGGRVGVEEGERGRMGGEEGGERGRGTVEGGDKRGEEKGGRGICSLLYWAQVRSHLRTSVYYVLSRLFYFHSATFVFYFCLISINALW